MTDIPDPIELMQGRMDRLEMAYVDEHTCMGCGTVVDYDLVCPSPTGDGPGLCIACSGYDYFDEIEPSEPATQLPDDLEF